MANEVNAAKQERVYTPRKPVERELLRNEYLRKFNAKWNGAYEVIGKYISFDKPILIKHRECGHAYEVGANYALKNGCKYCEHKNRFLELLCKKWNGEYKIVHKYIDAVTPIKFRHLKCGEIIEKSPSEMLRYGCKLCAIESLKIRMSSALGAEPQPIDIFTTRLHGKYGGRYSLISGYRGVSKTARFKCNECDREFNSRGEELMSGRKGCNCEFHQTRKENKALKLKEKEQTKILLQRKLKIDKQNFLEQVNDIWGDEFELLSEFKGYGNYVLVRHKPCGDIHKKLAQSLIRGYGCLLCSRAGRSAGATRVESYLKEKGMKFKREVRFEDCKRINKLAFDFILYNQNNKPTLAIEYDGEQHYRATIRYGGEEKLRLVKQRDEIKDEYCKSKGIRLVRVPYFIKDIPAYLDERLCSNL